MDLSARVHNDIAANRQPTGSQVLLFTAMLQSVKHTFS